MNHTITTEQIEESIKVLAEIPAKFSYGVIDMLRRLPIQIEKENNKDIISE